MLALFCHAVVTQRPLVVETHSYPAVASDDQPDRSAAHKNLDTCKYLPGHSPQTLQCITTMFNFHNVALTSSVAKRPILGLLRVAGIVWGATAEVCLASEWLRGRSMLTRISLYTSGCTKSIPTWNYEPRA